MKLVARNESFICEHCSRSVEPIKHGTCRDHCPYCLWGKHVDDEVPGDRASSCGGLMEPAAIIPNSKKGYQIVYRCVGCGKEQPNKAAEDDTYEGMLGLSTR